jgi:phosphopantetheine--protein transferase-like protein
MILGIGTDIVLVERFFRWNNYSKEQLQKIFSQQEILDCCEQGTRTIKIFRYRTQSLAARFAAKEAFYKAFSSMLLSFNIMPQRKISFLLICKHIHVLVDSLGRPVFHVNWEPLIDKIGCTIPSVNVHLSLTHEKNIALAFVIISEI